MEKKYIAIVLILAFIVGLLSAYWYEISNEQIPAPVPTDQFNVASITFFGTSGSTSNAINMSIQNVGYASWTIQTGPDFSTPAIYTVTAMSPTYNHNNNKLNCTNGNTVGISVTNVGWVSGNRYSITLMLTDGNRITYVSTAP